MADDWDKPTIIRKSKPTSKDLKSASVVNKAIAAGQVEITKKEKHVENAAHLAKLENSDDIKVQHVDKSVAKAIQAARQKLGITQKDLAAKICEKPTVVNEYESGKAIPSQQVLGKLERALNVKLRGSNIGAPLH